MKQNCCLGLRKSFLTVYVYSGYVGEDVQAKLGAQAILGRIQSESSRDHQQYTQLTCQSITCIDTVKRQVERKGFGLF